MITTASRQGIAVAATAIGLLVAILGFRAVVRGGAPVPPTPRRVPAAAPTLKPEPPPTPAAPALAPRPVEDRAAEPEAVEYSGEVAVPPKVEELKTARGPVEPALEPTPKQDPDGEYVRLEPIGIEACWLCEGK